MKVKNYINYQSEKHPILFDAQTIMMAKEAIRYCQGDSYFIAETFLYHGLKSGHSSEGRQMKFKFSDMEYLLDVDEVMTVLKDSLEKYEKLTAKSPIRDKNLFSKDIGLS